MNALGRKFAAVSLGIVFCALGWKASGAETQAEAPKIVGTWKLNLSKSKFNSGQPLKSRIITWVWNGKTLENTTHEVDSQGKKTVTRFSPRSDGKMYPVFDNDSKTPARYVRMKMIDPYTIEITSQKNGKDLTTYRHTVSKDGKTDTITQTGATMDGQQGTEVLVYDRQ